MSSVADHGRTFGLFIHFRMLSIAYKVPSFEVATAIAWRKLLYMWANVVRNVAGWPGFRGGECPRPNVMGPGLPVPVTGSRGSTLARSAIQTLGQARNSEYNLLANAATTSGLLTEVPST
jgi:hypothetical protein